MPYLNPLDALIPKIPFFFFAEFRVRVTNDEGVENCISGGGCVTQPTGKLMNHA